MKSVAPLDGKKATGDEGDGAGRRLGEKWEALPKEKARDGKLPKMRKRKEIMGDDTLSLSHLHMWTKIVC